MKLWCKSMVKPMYMLPSCMERKKLRVPAFRHFVKSGQVAHRQGQFLGAHPALDLPALFVLRKHGSGYSSTWITLPTPNICFSYTLTCHEREARE